MTAPHFGTKPWRAFPLEKATAAFLKKPVRVLNDAEVHGFGVISGRGLEVVLTLGTGIGSAVFTDGSVGPHLELAHHPIYENKTYNDYIGNKALSAIGTTQWNRRVLKTIAIVHTLLNYDTLYLGGGNAAKLTFKVPTAVKICSNDVGITGGIHLWSNR
jgi:polyphosphate glucokinase